MQRFVFFILIKVSNNILYIANKDVFFYFCDSF